MPVFNSNNTTKPFNGYIEKNTYALRVLSREFSNAKESGEPMITLQLEIISPETALGVNGETMQVAGAKFAQYLSFSPKAAGRTVDSLKALGIENFNTDPEVAMERIKEFDGMTISAVLGCDREELTRPLTPEQKAKGLKIGDKILDEKQQPIIKYKPKVINWLGRSSRLAGANSF